MKLIAQTFAGLEPVLARELEALGASNIQTLEAAVAFEGDKKLLYRANLELRTALQVLYPVATFRAQNEQHLYDGIFQIDWRRYLEIGGSIAVDADCVSNFFPKNGAAALRCRDAIGDRFEKRYGVRPSIDTKQPGLRVNLTIRGDFCQVCLDSSGIPLSDRGYGHQVLEDPINEVMAAGILQLTGWQGQSDFVNPMCASGTLLVEAATLAGNIPPAKNRVFFGFKKWPNYDEQLWEEVRNKAIQCEKTVGSGRVFGFDNAFQALRSSERNIQSAGLSDKIRVERMALEKLKPVAENSVVLLISPASGMFDEEQMRLLYVQLGEMIRKKCVGSVVYLVVVSEEPLRITGVKYTTVAEIGKEADRKQLIKFESL